MSRLTDGLLLIAAVSGALYTYQVKHEADQSARKLQVLRAQIAAQDRKIALLKADWAIATSPHRLEEVAERYSTQLKLRPLESSQIADVSELPALRQDRALEEDETIAGRVDGVVTGGIADLINSAEKNQ